jgi:hypothetical protein
VIAFARVECFTVPYHQRLLSSRCDAGWVTSTGLSKAAGRLANFQARHDSTDVIAINPGEFEFAAQQCSFSGLLLRWLMLYTDNADLTLLCGGIRRAGCSRLAKPPIIVVFVRVFRRVVRVKRHVVAN